MEKIYQKLEKWKIIIGFLAVFIPSAYSVFTYFASESEVKMIQCISENKIGSSITKIDIINLNSELLSIQTELITLSSQTNQNDWIKNRIASIQDRMQEIKELRKSYTDWDASLSTRIDQCKKLN